MAVLWIDGFDHYGTPNTDAAMRTALTAAGYLIGTGYTANVWSISAAPSTGNRMLMTNNRQFGPDAGGSQKLTVPADASTTAFVGLQITINAMQSGGGTGSGAMAHCHLFEVRGLLVAYNPGTGRIAVANKTTSGNNDPATYTDTGFSWPIGASYFVDVQIDTTSFSLYIDNRLVGAYPMTVNTNSFVLSPGFVGFGGGSGGTFYVDHVYAMSATGDDPKLRIGPQQVTTRLPTTLISNDLWTASVGSDFVGLVAKLVPNDGTYVSSPDSPNDGKQILYSTTGTPFTSGGTIRAVAYTVRAAKADSGVRNLTIVGGGKTLALSGLSTTVLVKSLIIGGAAGSWTPSRLQSDNFGVQVDA